MLASLIERLKAWQAIEGLSDAEMAELLGVKERMLGYLWAGDYRLSKRSLGRILIRLPGLRDAVNAYLTEEAVAA